MDPTRNNPPVAVRVVRPFPDEDALLAAESNVFTRTGIVLLGAPSRPNGVVLRFEICLQGGAAVMRGEGRVVGYRAPTDGEESALMLRFTRLDVKSKTLLDRAVAIREERRSLAPPVAAAPPKPSEPHEDEAMDVDEVDLKAADDSDRTQQPPVVVAAPHAPGPKEKAPVPSPSPGGVPVPHPIAPPTPATPIHAPEPSPHPRGPEHLPIPQRSPEPKRHLGDTDFRTTLEPPQRDSALERLRERKRASRP
jgi:hypothetical protein